MSCTVRGRAVADDFGVYPRAARLGAFELLEHEHARPARDHEAVAVLVIGARGLVRRLVEVDDMAPMASNSTESVQSSSSQPPAKIRSCLPHWIVSSALPMQWFEVAQADEIE